MNKEEVQKILDEATGIALTKMRERFPTIQDEMANLGESTNYWQQIRDNAIIHLLTTKS